MVLALKEGGHDPCQLVVRILVQELLPLLLLSLGSWPASDGLLYDAWLSGFFLQVYVTPLDAFLEAHL